MDVRERVVQRDGKVLPLTPKVFDILLVMVQNAGRILLKDEMMRLVWPDTMVEESNLTRNVSTLRKALGEKPNECRYIETIPWRGYRFVGEVVRHETEAIESLAVLPFVNDSADPSTEYLSEGITDSLINKLSLLASLRVVSRNSVFRYKARDPKENFPDAAIVGRELGVRAVLTGRIRCVDGIVLVSAELVDASDDRHIWGGQYNRQFPDILSMQETLAQEIAGQLRLKLSGQDKERLERRHTENPEAYQLYLRGRYFWNKLTPDGVRKAQEFFQQAVDLDSGYALAYTGLMNSYTSLNQPVEARKAAARALELDPDLGEAHAALGFLKFLYDWDFSGAEIELKRSIALNPNYAEAHHWYAIYLGNVGRFQEAVQAAKRARELDPLSLLMNQTAGNVLMLARDYDGAVAALHKTLELDANFAAAHSVLGSVYCRQGKFEEAVAELEKVRSLAGGHPLVDANIKALAGWVYAAWGKTNEARNLLAEISNPPGATPYNIAAVYAVLGETDSALEWLQRAYQSRSFELVSLKVDSRFDKIRPDSRFADLVQRVGL
jgi:TolB-like protein/Flp pilus assembly protein TadD